ncbi:hypothetical protein N656DRAFT_310166 [Canariomyces notabilis]|uniref:Uncharacterized protein n=1 Tax=Canariomyces notabilis TaxID=2074819 RepID=A0AAN6QGQ9_9PEZI|nr:hypothetical protein N656DRAFT_310166 [Canariomyces arenarius]
MIWQVPWWACPSYMEQRRARRTKYHTYRSLLRKTIVLRASNPIKRPLSHPRPSPPSLFHPPSKTNQSTWPSRSTRNSSTSAALSAAKPLTLVPTTTALATHIAPAARIEGGKACSCSTGRPAAPNWASCMGRRPPVLNISHYSTQYAGLLPHLLRIPLAGLQRTCLGDSRSVALHRPHSSSPVPWTPSLPLRHRPQSVHPPLVHLVGYSDPRLSSLRKLETRYASDNSALFCSANGDYLDRRLMKRFVHASPGSWEDQTIGVPSVWVAATRRRKADGGLHGGLMH